MSMKLGEAQISEGATGLDVKKLQEILNGGGYNAGPIDGIFGAQTLKAVKAFQTAKNIPADGIVGPLTWSALIGPTTPPIPPPAAPEPEKPGALAFLNDLSMPMLLALGVGAIAIVSYGMGGKRK